MKKILILLPVLYMTSFPSGYAQGPAVETGVKLLRATVRRSPQVTSHVIENSIQTAAKLPRGQAQSPVAYFHQLTQEGPTEEILSGDPYAKAIRNAYKMTRNWVNGQASRPQSSSWLTQCQRQQWQPTTLLSAPERHEFNTIVATSRAMAQTPSPRRRLLIEDRPFTLDNNWNPLPPDQLTETALYDRFDPKNYLSYEDNYTGPFHPQVNNLQVLIVSEEPDLVAYLQAGAKREPRVRLTVTSGGDEAIGLLKRDPNKFHVILTDIHMENGSGHAVAAHTISEQLPCYVVALSKASASPATFFLMGFDGFMTTISSLEARRYGVEEFLQRHQQENPYRHTQQIFNYLSNLVGNGGHAYPVNP